MPRKSTAAELQAEEAAVNSPLRRSSRLVSGNGTTTAAGVITRRTSQSAEPESNIPARATRTRRASAQDSEEKVEVKPVTRTRRASLLAEEEPKEEVLTPAKRSRKPSVTAEPEDKEGVENPKPVRARRGSAASSTGEAEETKPQKSASVRTRRSSATIEPETEVRVAAKTPARAVTRRSSAAENAVVEEVSTPGKRTTRGRKGSNAEDNIEESKKPTARSRRKSINQEDDKVEETVKPAGKRGRKLSTDLDNLSVDTIPKTPGRRLSVNKETDNKESSKVITEDGSKALEANTSRDSSHTDEGISPIVLKEVFIKVTPLKKRKILDKMEDLDLSIINESSDDIGNSKNDDSSKEIAESEKEVSKHIQSSQRKSNWSADNLIVEPLNNSGSATPITEDGVGTSPNNKSFNLADKAEINTLEPNNEAQNTPSKKRTAGNDETSSPRKSPRLTEKLSRNNTPKEEIGNIKVRTPRESKKLIKENEIEVSVNEKSVASFVSSGSDGSFKFHASNMSMANSSRHDSIKENAEGDLLNTSKESTSSNKENIEQVGSISVSKETLDKSTIPVQEPIIVARVSNVFRPTQRDYSFMEPMEVDEDSIMYTEASIAETNTKLDNCAVLLDKDKAESSTESKHNFTGEDVDPNELSVIFNYKTSVKMAKKATGDTFILDIPSSQEEPQTLPLSEYTRNALNDNVTGNECSTTDLINKETQDTDKSSDISTLASPNLQKDGLTLPKLNALKENLTETEGSDTNLVIEETQDTVNFSVKTKSEKAALTTQRMSNSPAINDGSLIITNEPLEKVKLALLGKSSSPIIFRKKSKSSMSRASDSTDSDDDIPRRSKSKSKSPYGKRSDKSPSFISGSTKTKALRQSDDALTVPRRSKSKSKSPSPRRSSDRSPSFLSVDIADNINTRKSKSPVPRDSIASDRSKLKGLTLRSATRSPSYFSVDVADNVTCASNFGETPIAPSGKKLRSKRSQSKSPLPDSERSPNVQNNDNLNPERVFKRKSKSILKDPDEIPTAQADNLRSSSKSPLPEPSLAEQSFEKPRGTEEIIISNERKSIEPYQDVENKANAKDQNTSIKELSHSASTNLNKTAEEMSSINNTKSERTNMEDKTMYHTAIATTNNESDFASMLNTDNEIIESPIKDSESTHYDFDLDSDDDLVNSKRSSSVTGIEVGVLEKHSAEQMNEGLGVTEPKESLKESKSPKTEYYESTDDQKTDEVPKVIKEDGERLLKQNSSIAVDIEEDSTESAFERESSSKEDKDNLSTESQNDNVEEQSKEIIVTSTTRTEDAEPDINNSVRKSDLSTAEKGIHELLVENIEDSKTTNENDTDLKNISEIEDENHVLQVNQSEVTDCEHISGKDSTNEPVVEIKHHEKKEKRALEEKELKVENETGDDNSLNDKNRKRIKSNRKESRQDGHELSEVSVETNHSKRSKNKKTKKIREKQNKNVSIHESVEETDSCKVKSLKVDKFQSDENDLTNKKTKSTEASKSIKTKPSLDEFASLKLEEYLSSEALKLEESSSEEEEESNSEEENESEAEYNEFIDGMAEEGEEDTPSEDSNQIIDEGESIGSTSDEDSSDDDYDSNDSFICDEVDQQLLSGDEYDLGNERKKPKAKKSRIIDPRTLGEEDIIKITKKVKVQKKEQKKRSRIITVTDSSEEEPELAHSVLEVEEDNDKKDEDHVKKDVTVEESVILLEESAKHDEDSHHINLIENAESTENDIEKTKDDNFSKSVFIIEDSNTASSSVEESLAKDINSSVITEESTNEHGHHDISLVNLNNSVQRRNRKSSLSIQENIIVDGKKDPLITQRINTLVESFCSTVKQGEISLNLSLEYEGTPEEKAKNQVVNVLSDIKICPSRVVIPPERQEEREEVDLQEASTQLEQSRSSNETGHLGEVLNRKNRKRKLSKSLDEIQEEVKESKRTKTHKVDKDKKKTVNNKVVLTGRIGKPKKQTKLYKGLTEQLQSTISSFGIMNQLITDVKNRPRRMIKPTKSDIEVESAWTTTKVTNLKPSTSPITRQEKSLIQPKLHPKDFKNQMLSDGKRVKRIDTKTLLKKKGAFN